MKEGRAAEQSMTRGSRPIGQSSRAEARTHHASRITASKGFTLVEMAIVLVIIGVIVGAVLKGQDLVDNARHKRLESEVKQWEALIWTYSDMEKRFPGDGDKNGTIGDATADDPKTDLEGANFASIPASNTIIFGSSTFYIYFGNAGSKKNAIIVCRDIACGSFVDTEFNYAKYFDGAIDETVSGTAGRVQGFLAVTSPDSSKWKATLTAASATAYTSGMKAFAYFFDRRL